MAQLVMEKMGFLVLAITIILVVSAFGVQLFKAAQDNIASASCETSIDRTITLRLGGKAFTDRINCQPAIAEFSGSDEQVKRAAANAMVTCWDRWKRGKEELFALRSETFCDVCAIFDPATEPRQVGGFLTFLGTETTTSGETYLTALQGTEVQGEIFKEGNPAFAGENFDTSKSYAAVFVYKKKDFRDPEKYGLIGTAGGGALGFFIPIPGGTRLGAAAGAAGGYLFSQYLGQNNELGASVAFVPYERDQLANWLGCTDFPVNPAR